MTSRHKKVLPDHDRGICTTCDHFLTCRLHSEDGKPVFFCEEFMCTSEDSQERKPEIYGLPGQHDGRFIVKKSENARPDYIGLCRTCARLATCKFLKPGGGTWQCEFYEENLER